LEFGKEGGFTVSIIATIVIVGGAMVGGIKALEASATKHEAKLLMESARLTYESAKKRMEEARARTSEVLTQLGDLKLKIWSDDLARFIRLYDHIGDFRMNRSVAQEVPFRVLTAKDISEIREHSGKIEAVASLAAGAGAGYLMAAGAYGAASLFGVASTGTAISTLAGVAAHNATLAWLGGGALAAGGGGMAAGGLVLGGLALGPALAVAGLVNAAVAHKSLAEATRIRDKAEEAAKEMDEAVDAMLEITEFASKVYEALCVLRHRMASLLIKLDALVATKQRKVPRWRRFLAQWLGPRVARISYAKLDETEQTIVKESVNTANMLRLLSETALLKEDGTLDETSRRLLASVCLEHNQSAGNGD